MKMPAVFTDCYFREDEIFRNVGTEDEEGAYQAASYLIGKGAAGELPMLQTGHTIRTDSTGDVSERRLAGYKRALKEAHLPFAQEHIYMGSIHEDRQLAMLQSLAGHIFDYTAVIFSRDYYALEAMDYFRHHGIWIPKDISIIGFDDLGMSKFAYPRLTTVRQGGGGKRAQSRRTAVSGTGRKGR